MSNLDKFFQSLEKEKEEAPTELSWGSVIVDERSEKERMKEFFFGRPSFSGGRCSVCGQDGEISLSTFYCRWHGEIK
jgi:hypothetical protein